MRFLVLGPVEVSSGDGPLSLGGRKQRLVLAHLIVRANTVVPTEVLIDEVWGDEPPDSVRSTLQGYVSHLRRVVGAERLQGRPSGYALRIEEGELDSASFESLVAEGRASLDVGPEDASATLAEALSLWRGPAFADLADERSLQGTIARLSELRLLAVEDRLSAELTLGRHQAIVGELEALAVANPLRERLWGLLMLAQYRSGRQGDALTTYQEARSILAEQLGIDPSRALQRLYERILAQDPALSIGSRMDAVITGRGRGELNAGDRLAGYTIRSVLGRGGMGVVYLAEHEGLRRNVALKVLSAALGSDPRFRERFIRESQLAASLEHPHVVPIYEAGEADGAVFIAMRFVDGTDLRRLIAGDGALEPARAVRIVRQVADALDAAHARGLVHRDVKPGNILLARRPGSDGEDAYLSDFGLTKRTSSLSGLTGTGQFVGTVHYAAPEQFEGAPIDARTDVYSLGCVIYECLTGRPPFERPNDAAVMYAHLMDPPPRPTLERPELPEAIDRVLARALSKRADDRHSTTGELASAAADALAPLDAAATEPKPTGPAPTRPRRRPRPARWPVSVAAAIAVLLLAFMLPRVLEGDGVPGPMFRPGVALIDPQTLEPVAHLRVEEPVEAHFSDGSFWFLNVEPLSFVRVDAASRGITDRIASPVDDVSSFAVDGDSLWVTNGSHPILARVDIRTGRVADRYSYADVGEGDLGLLGPVVGGGSVWVTYGDQVLRIEPGSGKIQDVMKFGARRDGYMSFSEGNVWVPGFARVARIDPTTGEVARSVPLYEAQLTFPLGAGAFGWVASPDRNQVFQYHSNGGLIRSHRTGQGPESLAFGDGRIWVANYDSGSIGTIDVRTGRTASVDVGHPVRGIAFGAGLVAATVGPGRSVADRLAAVRGSTLTIAATDEFNDVVDPAVADDPGMWQIERATCAKLLNYPDAAAPVGSELRPEVAAAPPEISDDGRTYTFTIRDGFVFSPPSNDAITAETFRFSIERALSPDLGAGAPGYRFLSDIVGVDSFRAEETEHITGLTAAADSLSITLEQPSGDFLHRLAMPFFCPVPTDTPILEGGVGAAPLASAGPYFVSESVEEEVLILRRNPNYAGDRRGVFDAIVFRFGFNPFGVNAGELPERQQDWDAVVGFSDGLLNGANSGFEGFSATSLAAMDFIAFNAAGDAFSDAIVRKAASLAIDRFTFTQFGGVASDAFLPPDLPGAEGELHATLPDTVRASRLLGGRNVEVTFAVSPALGRTCESFDDRFCQSPAREQLEDLEEAGFGVQIETVARSAVVEDPRFDLAFGVEEILYPDTATFVSHTILDGQIPATWFPTDVRREAIRVQGLTGDERTAAAVALAERLVDEHIVVPLGMPARSAYVSDRIACLVYPPFGWGFDLVSACPAA